ncbi:putative Alpha-galactosidase [Vibrio aestuarianus]|nr:putative Alpha-galactosidase [Vibrio aestuarianus]
MATAAKELGVERFIIDDGWFPARNHDSAGLGDWFVDKEKYPQGLHPVADHVTGLGMELGLWFEPEMVNPDSQLCRKHPDWVLATGHYERLTERQQYVLNLQNPACFKYLFNCIDALLAEYPISYIKWDHNRVLVQASHNGLPGVHGQTRAVYRLIDQLRKAHPHVEIESCSSGGARIDMEVLKRTHRFWTSDTNDPVERQTIQQGFSYFFPPELMGAHVGTHASHTSGRRNSIAFRASTALFGHMGMELDPLCLSDEQKCEVKMFFDLHKSYRDLLHRGDLFRLDYPDDTSIAKVMVSKDKSTALVSMAQIQSRSYTLPVPLRLAGLDPDKTYRVQVVSNENDEYTMKKQPAWCEHGVELTGEVLMKVGLQLPVLWPESCLLVGIQQIRVE